MPPRKTKRARHVKVVRLEADLTQAQMAERLGVSAGTVSHWETGRSKPSVAQLQELDDLLVTPAEEDMDGLVVGPDGPALPMGDPRKSFSGQPEVPSVRDFISVVNKDAQELYDLLTNFMPDGIGKLAARKQLAWGQQGRFNRVRGTLAASGVVKTVSGGKGGRLVIVEGKEMPDYESLDVGTERALYEGIMSRLGEIILAGDPDNEELRTPSKFAMANTGDLGRTNTGGSLSRPDLVGVVRRRVKGFDALEVHGFEVKAYWATERFGIYEALAQRALDLCTHAWVVLYLPDRNVNLSRQHRRIVDRTRQHLNDLHNEAKAVGLGLVVVNHFGNGGLDPMVYPKRHPADPRKLGDFLDAACRDLLPSIGISPEDVVG